MYINHVIFVLDESSSMSGLTRKTMEVFNSQVDNLRSKSNSLNQETRISVYAFSDRVKCLAFDEGVDKFKLRETYRPSGNTALMDAIGTAIEEHQEIPQKRGDHAFLIYALTDGEENKSNKFDVHSLSRLISRLEDNWTVSCLVPNARGVMEAKRYGIPKDNIQIWETTEHGLEEVERGTVFAMNNYLNLRSTGVRGMSNFYSNASDLTVKDVKAVAKEISPKNFNMLSVNKTAEIRDFVQEALGTFYPGCAFYQLTKPETIQGYKLIAVRNRKTDKVYSGAAARDLLSLPSYDLKVTPGDHGDWDIFVQSTSVNRKLFPGSELLVLKAGV